jgi:NADPH-dependent 2,4-dienoyl-CoA reductase/sulfur reductase-like enzyme
MIHLVNSKSGNFSVKADAIVFATGARERTAAERGWIAGARGARVWHTLDILRLLDRLGTLPGRHPAVIGSDLIAYATAAKLKTAGAETVAMIDTTATPRASLLSRLYFSRWGRPRWFGSAERAELIGDGYPSSIRLDCERTVDCDMVVLSGDLVPNSELLMTAGLPVESPDRIPVVSDGCRLAQDGWFVAGGLLGGFRGAYSCYRNGLRVAKYVVGYLKANALAKSQCQSR